MLSVVEVLSLVGGLGVSLASGALYLVRKRRRDREANRRALAAKWTNEGEVTGEQPATLLTLYLAVRAGDVTGELESPGWPRSLDASVEVGWITSRVTLLAYGPGGRPRQVATARVRLRHDRTRLVWHLERSHWDRPLPDHTELWPDDRPNIHVI